MGIVMRYLVCLVLFSLFGCSHQIAITKVAEAQVKPALDNSNSMIESKAESPVKVIGYFTNVKGDGEHQWGYSVMIWKQEDKIYGFISGDDDLRLIGDPPTGVLENVQFDPKTKRLSFRAKLSTGLIGDKVWSRDVYEFDGVLTNKKLKGNIKVTNQLCAENCAKPKMITLRYSNDMTLTMQEYQSYAEWKSFADEILKFRGPKW